MRFAFCLAGNLYGSSPDASFTKSAMSKIDTVVYLNTSLNTGHAWGTGAEQTIILPVLARDEEPEPSTQESMFSFIRLSEGGTPRHPVSDVTGPRAEVAIIAELALRVLGEESPVNWRDMAHTTTIRRALAAIVPGLEQRLDQSIGSMSGGQRQIVTLLMATWHRPELLLLDEHTAALDPAAADRVVQATAGLIREGRLTALMVTHSLAQAASLGDRLILVHRGRIELDVEGPAKRRLTPDDLADRFDALRRADQLDDAAARTLADLYV
jgi:hypothetical protein